MKVELDDDYLDIVVKQRLQDSLGYYKRMADKDKLDYFPVVSNDYKEDQKYIKKMIKAYERVLEDYMYV